ncbi:MAG: NFACT RNA binding domain-containing protein [Candidatus Cloacimonadota bacterium]|nr:NFACT RNA binding domain-containing protein [Candidatus Cloacimonadota bacterium]
MDYKFLKAWAEQVKLGNKRIKDLQRFEDQYVLFFVKKKNILQINLGNDGGFCFFTQKQMLPFQKDNTLNKFLEILKDTQPEKVSIDNQDRILKFEFSKIDIYNRENRYFLFLELIPRYQNIILTDGNEKILECRRKISYAENRTRQILPGLKYEKPTTNFIITEKKVRFPICLNENLQLEENNLQGTEDMNLIFEKLYYESVLEKRNKRIKQKKIKNLRQQISKKERKLDNLDKELQTASKEKKWKQYAELLNANFNRIKNGADSIILKNYYEEGFPEIEIPLQAELTPLQNVEKYFKKYRKARDGKKKIAEQIKLTEQEISNLELQIAEIQDKDFLIYQNEERGTSRTQKKYKRIKLGDSWQIFVGRSSKENDFLTKTLAQPHDWWFHTRIFKGTHVVLRNLTKQELPEELKLICCRLAAYFSKAKKSRNVPVDYTQIRYVRKPKGSPPGFVIYDKQKTLYVDPLSFREAVKFLSKKWELK